MKQFVRLLSLWITVVFAPVVLSACATIGLPAKSPAQTLYAAHSSYNIVLARFVAYAETDKADGAVVLQGKAINDKARPAFRYAEAYIACTERGRVTDDPVLTVANIRCSDWSFDAASIRNNGTVLQSATSNLFGLLKKVIS